MQLWDFHSHHVTCHSLPDHPSKAKIAVSFTDIAPKIYHLRTNQLTNHHLYILSPRIKLPQESLINTTTTSAIIIASNMAITRSSRASAKDMGKLRRTGPTCLRKLTKERLAALFPTLQARPIVRKTLPAAKGQIGASISKCVQSTYTLSKSQTQNFRGDSSPSCSRGHYINVAVSRVSRLGLLGFRYFPSQLISR